MGTLRNGYISRALLLGSDKKSTIRKMLSSYGLEHCCYSSG